MPKAALFPLPMRSKSCESEETETGQRTLLRAIVMKPTKPPKHKARKTRETFSLHACWLGLSLIPQPFIHGPQAQKVTMREKIRHDGEPGSDLLDAGPCCGLMSGT